MNYIIQPLSIPVKQRTRALEEREYFAKLQERARLHAKKRRWRRAKARFRLLSRRIVKGLQAKPLHLSRIT